MIEEPIPFYRPCFSEETRRSITKDMDGILASGELMMGPYRRKFEEGFQKLSGTSDAISVNSATTALQIALTHFDVKGFEVLVPAASFVTDVGAVIFAGGTPVLVDVDPETFTFDLGDLQKKVSSKTKGLILVHLAGMISPAWESVVEFARSRGLFVIEDASHAHGASFDGRPAGSLGDVGVFSFYPTKIVSAGTGGMLTTNDPVLAKFAREIRLFGKADNGEIIHVGNDWFLDEIRACVGYHHFMDLERQSKERRRIAERYTSAICDGESVRAVPRSNRSNPSWYHYPIILRSAAEMERLRDGLSKKGIASKAIYKPVHKETVFQTLDTGDLRGAELALGRTLCLPMFVGLKDAEIDRVVAAVAKIARP